MRNPKSTNRVCSFEPLGKRRIFAADLELVDIFLRDYQGNRVETALIGESIEVVAQWTTRELPSNASYDVRFRVNSYELTIPSVSQGAGLASFSANYAQLGWYAQAGVNTIEVTIDPRNSVAESSENNNVRQQTFDAAIPTPPTQFHWPLAGRLLEDFGISNDYDVDPSSRSVDFLGRTVYADGHIGWDIGPGPFSANDNGLEVLATADGTITWADDGTFDREIVTGNFATNGFAIDHGDGWRSLYVHLRRDSITVKIGDHVKAGQVLGLVGSSGNSSGPHLHFEVVRNGRAINLMIGREYYLATDVIDRFEHPSMKDLSISNREVIGSDYIESISSSRVFLTNENKRVIIWFTVLGWQRPGPFTYAVYRPNGSLLYRSDGLMDFDAGLTIFGNYYFDLPPSAMPGRWNIKYSYAGVQIGEDFFEVAASGLPEVSLRKDNNIVAESRWTPYDFATVAAGATAPSMRFTIENHGKAELVINGLEVPSWVTITKPPPLRLQPGTVDYFDIAASTDMLGTRWAQVALLTNDASEKRSTFQVQSTITSGSTRSARVGLMSQYATEGQTIVGKVYRSSPDDQPVVFDLSTSSSSDVTVPASVTIPPFTAWVSFPVQVRDDAAVESLERIDIIATPHSGYSPAISELLVIDNDQLSGDVSLTVASSSVVESQRNLRGTVSRTGEIRDSLVVNLYANDRSGIRLPLFITIPAFRNSVDFDVTIADDDVASGDREIEIVAAVFGRAAGRASFTVVDNEVATLSVALAASLISENGGNTTGTVTRNTPTTTALVVNLSSSDLTEATVPSTVTIPAGATSATFTITAVNDAIADGNQVSTLTASASGFVSGTAQVTVVDDEVANLVLSLSSSSISENGGTTTGTVTRNTPTETSLVVNLSVSDATATTVPSTVTIPAGATSASFTIAAVDDVIADGNQVSILTASVTGFVSGTAQVIVVDDETAMLTLVIAAESILENGGSTTGTVIRNTPTTAPLIVSLSSSNRAAATVPSTVTIPAGVASVTFTVTAVNDSIATGNQVSTLLASASGFASGTAQITVLDDEVASLVLTLLANSISENGGTTTGTVTRNTSTTASLVVNLSSSDSTAATVPSTVTIPAGATSALFTITAVNDAVLDGNQASTLTASAGGFVSGTAQVIVVDDEVETLVLSLSSSSVSENGGTTTGTVTRNTSTATSLVVNLSSSDLTATTVPSTVTIPAGATSASFIIAAVDDVIADGNQVSILTASVTGFVSGTAQVIVVDDETATLTLAIAAESILENSGSTTGTVTRNTPTTAPLIVNLSSSNTAVATVPSTVTIPAGVASVTFTVTGVNDSIATGNQVSTLLASASGSASGTAQITVLDDEVASLVLTLLTSSISENGGTTTGTVTRNTPTAAALLVNLSSSDLTAATVPSTVTIPAGATSAQFTITAVNDAVLDGNQASTLTASAGGFVSSTAQVTVVDDEVETLVLSLSSSSVSENGGPTTGTVTRNTSTATSLVVNLSSSDLTATTVPSTVTIPTGATSATFTIAAVDDVIADGNQVSILTAIVNGFVSGTAQVIVVDDETATLTLVIAATSIPENGGSTTGTVTRNTPTNTALIVNLTSTDTTVATVPAFVTIPVGEFSVNFAVSAVNDSRYRGNMSTQILVSAVGISDASIRLDVMEDDPQWPWNNSRNPVDVNFDGKVSPIDALLVINFLNSGRRGVLPAPEPGVNAPPPYVDVNHDGSVSPIDALLVINHLNERVNGEGENEMQNAIAMQTFGDLGWLDSLTIDSRKLRRRQ